LTPSEWFRCVVFRAQSRRAAQLLALRRESGVGLLPKADAGDCSIGLNHEKEGPPPGGGPSAGIFRDKKPALGTI
jgi:hypothetical protein